MHKKIFLTIMTILLMAILTLPAVAWVYHDDPADDGLFEKFGPRADRLLIKLYADDAGEFAALEAHDIDLTDWPISKTESIKWSETPYSDYINIVNYGPEFGLFILDLNSNTNRYKGNPPEEKPGDVDWDYMESPIGYPNPMGEAGMRRAIAYLVNRDEYVADPSIGAGFGVPMYTTMPLAMEKYLYDVTANINIPWAYEYSRAAANATLDAWGFDTFDGEGYRIWNETAETVNLHFYIRNDHPGRLMIGSKLLVELEAVGLKVTTVFGDSSACSGPVMYTKDFHLYTGGWSLGVDPDHLILWSWDYYWHPGFCYDYGGHNDPDFNEAAAGIMYANTQEEAVTYAYQAQLAQATNVLSIPLYCVSGNKAYHKTYVGNEAGEEEYYEEPWVGVKNMMGYGIDNGWTLMNMHPECPLLGTGTMTIRWGFKASEIKQFNPVYSQWLYDWNAMDPCFTSLLSRNPNDLGTFMPSVAKAFEVTTYTHPNATLGLGECTKIRFTMRDDVYWSDGVKLTLEDVRFTFVELKKILAGRGLPNPWWYSNVADVLSFNILDPCNFEVLLGVKSYWALGWLGGNIILPKHIWEPIAQFGDPEAAQPDPLLIGSGPWKFVSYGGVGTTVLHERNPWYFKQLPFDVEIKIDGTDPNLEYTQRIEPCTPPGDAWFVVTLHNQKKLEPEMVTTNLVVDKFIYFTNKTAATKTLVKSSTGITLESCVPHVETVTLAEIATALGIELPSWPRCKYDIDVEVHITGPPEFCPTQPNPWICRWKNVTFDWFGTIQEDLNFDCTVNYLDGIVLGAGFSGMPGSENWNSKGDINGDLVTNYLDGILLGAKFGWPTI